MKKIFYILIFIVLLLNCGNDASLRIQQLQKENAVLKSKLEIAKVTELENSGKKFNYFLLLELKQSHFTLDITKHLKDKINAVTFQIPTTKEFYTQCVIGEKLVDEFREGSAWMELSFGSWEVTIKDKKILEIN